MSTTSVERTTHPMRAPVWSRPTRHTPSASVVSLIDALMWPIW